MRNTELSRTPVHTVFGAGQIGLPLARHLAQSGHRVRLVRRGPAGSAIPGVTWMSGDANDRSFADEACRDAAVVYNCTNPPDYHKWEGVLEPLYRAIWEAAGRAEARLVQLDNVYMYGPPNGRRLTEDRAYAPCSYKGELRAKLAEDLMAAHRSGDVQATAGRASDYFGPASPNAVVFRPDTLDRIKQGKSVYVLADPSTPHSYSYTADVVRGLATLGVEASALGRAWHLPVASQLSTRDLVNHFAEAAHTQVTVRQVPAWVLRAMGWVSPLVAAINEMSYQWDEPFIVDDSAFRGAFGIGPTPLDEAIRESLGEQPAAVLAS